MRRGEDGRSNRSALDGWTGRNGRWRTAYLVASIVLIAVYPLLPKWGRDADGWLVLFGAIPFVLVGLQRISPGERRPWWLLVAGLAAVGVGSVIALLAGDVAPAGSSAFYAAGMALFLGAALALIVRRGRNHLGSIIDTAIVALALGGLLWSVGLEPHMGAFYDSGVAETNLYVAVLALCGLLGALARLAQVEAEPVPALRLLIAAFVLALAGYILATLAPHGWLRVAAVLMFMAMYTTIGLFGLDPTAPKLAQRAATHGEDSLSIGRLVFLGAAVAAIPIVDARAQLGDLDGFLPALSIAIIVMLVMTRIYGVSADRDRLARALKHEATHDPLTGLPNRREFVAQLRTELSLAPGCAILFCDLDRFKAINDQLGHDAGDTLLVETARRLRASVRDNDVVSRFGGDEFLIMLPHTTHTEIETICRRIVQSLSRPVELHGENMTIGASIGMAVAADETNPEDLIKRADAAMYMAKKDHAAAPGVRRFSLT
jgi:diguanylate cyclase